MKQFHLIALGLLSLSLLASASPVDPAYSQLKTFRNYFAVESTTKLSHRFHFWFVSKDYVHCTVAGETEADLQKITKKDLRCSWGLFAVPPAQTQAVPTELAPMEKLAQSAVEAAYPGLTKLQVGYGGHYRGVVVREIIPFAGAGEPFERRAMKSRVSLMVDADYKTVKSEPGAIQELGGYTMLCFDFLHDCDKAPVLIDYLVPASIQGSSVVGNYFYATKGPYDQAWRDFSLRLEDTLKALDAGKYQSPLASLLAKQGETLLPEGLNQYLQLSVTLYGRVTHGEQVSDRVELKFPVAQAYAEELTLSGKAEKLGVTLQMTLSLADSTLTLTAVDEQGEEDEGNFALTGETIEDGGRVAIPSLSVKRTDPRPDETKPFSDALKLPGHDSFTSIDVFPDTAIYNATTYVVPK